MKLFSWFRRRHEAETRRKKALVFFVLFFGIAALSLASFSPPYVVQTDPAQRESKVTFNAPFTIHFSHLMRKSSVEKAFQIVPKIEGHFEWKNYKTLEFHPKKDLKIDDRYKIVIRSLARSLWFKGLDLDTELNYLVTGPPYVLYSNPENEGLVTKGGAITVMFDRPMAFSESSAADLITIKPPIKGTIRYMGLSAFQFLPDKLPANQEISVLIPKGLDALDGGSTQKDLQFILRTPNLTVESVSPKNESIDIGIEDEIKIQFSHPVDLNNIKPGLNVLLYPSNDFDNGEEAKMDGFFNTEVTHAVNSDGDKKEGTLIFKPSFAYQKGVNYRLVLKAAEGFGLQEDYELHFRTKEDEKVIKEDKKIVESVEEILADTTKKKMRWEGDKFMEFFVVGQNPRLRLEEPLTKEVWLSVCSIPSSQFMRVNSQQAWKNFECETEAKKLNPLEKPFGKELNLADYFKDEWIHGVYFASLQMEGEKLDKLFFIEDASLIFKKSSQDLLVWATDIKTGSPIGDMTIEVFDFDGEEIAKGKTNDKGIYILKQPLGVGIYVRGKKGPDSETYFVIASDRWRLGTEGMSQQEPSGLLITTNQNVFEPNETLWVQGIWRALENQLLTFPENNQVVVSLEDESHNVLIDKRIPMRRNGSFDASLAFPEDTPDGLYFLNIADLNSQQLTDPRPIMIRNRASEINLEWLNTKDDHVGSEASIYIVRARYKNGLPATGLRATYQLFAKHYEASYQEGSTQYSFSSLEDLCKNDCDQRRLISDGDLEFNADGEGRILLVDDEGDFLPAGQEYELEVTTITEDFDEAMISTDFKIHQGEFELGLGLKHAIFDAGEPIEMSVLAFGQNTELLEGQKVSINLVKAGDLEIKYNETITTKKVPLSVSIPGQAGLKEGAYLLRAESVDSKRNKIRAEKSVYVVSDEGGAIDVDLALITDQPKYFVGGRAHLVISDPEASKDHPVTAIVSYERDGLLGYQSVELSSAITRITVPIEKEMVPHFRVNVTRFHRGLSPYYSTASTLLEIENDESKILVDIFLDPPNPQAGDEVTVHIKTTDFQDLPLSTIVSLNVFDGVSKIMDPLWRHFYAENPQALNGATSINFDLDENSEPPSPRSAIGFNAQAPSMYFNPLVTTDEGGKASVSFRIPQGTQTLGMSAIATKDKIRFGSGMTSLKLSNRLFIQPILPSFVIPGDQTIFGVSLKNVSEQEISSRIELISGGVAIQGDGARNFSLKPGQQTTMNFKVLVDSKNKDILEVQFKSAEDVLEISLPVKHLTNHFDLVTSTLDTNLWTGRALSPQESYPGTGNLQILMSGSPKILAKLYTNAFEKFDYESADILARKLIVRASLTNPDDEEALASLRIMLNQLLKQVDSGGGYRYWNERNPNPHLTALALLAYKEVMQLGIHIDSLLLNHSVNFLFSSLADGEIPLEDQAFILWALGTHGNFDTERSLELFAERKNMDLEGQAFLVLNLDQLIQAGQNSVLPILDRLQSELVDVSSTSGEITSFDGSLKTSTLMIYALNKVNPENPLIKSLVNFLFSTEAKLLSVLDPELASWTIMALNSLNIEAKPPINYIARVKVNGDLIIDQSVTAQSINEIFERLIDGSTLSASSVNDIFVKKEGEGPFYFDAHLFSYTDPAKVKSVEEGVLIVRSYFEISDDNSLSPAHSFKKGKKYLSRLEFIVSQDLTQAALTEPLPAGFRSTLRIGDIGAPFDSLESKDDFVRLYTTLLPAGVYTVDIPMTAVLSGSYQHLPATLQAIYEPTIRAQTSSELIPILE